MSLEEIVARAFLEANRRGRIPVEIVFGFLFRINQETGFFLFVVVATINDENFCHRSGSLGFVDIADGRSEKILERFPMQKHSSRANASVLSLDEAGFQRGSAVVNPLGTNTVFGCKPFFKFANGHDRMVHGATHNHSIEAFVSTEHLNSPFGGSPSRPITLYR